MSSSPISGFTRTTTVAGTDLLDIVRAQQNFSVLFSDLTASLGTTGSLSVVGGIGSPVLEQPVPGINNIRTLESGKGIIASISVQNGITLDHNFANTAGGVGVIKDVTSTITELRSIIPGTGINVSVDGDNIQISQSSAPVSTKTVIVSTAADFPIAIAGVITLDADTDYLLVNDVAISDQLSSVPGKTNTIRDGGTGVVTLTYTGTASLFTAVDPKIKISDISLNAANGSIFSVTGAAKDGIVDVSNCSISAASLGTVSDVALLRTFANILSMTAGGIVLGGAVTSVDFDSTIVNSLAAGILYDLGTSTISNLSLFKQDIVSSGAGTSFLSGLPGSGNIASTGTGAVLNVRLSGPIVPLIGITANDDRWEFALNDGIKATRPIASVSATNNIAETVIVAINTPVKVNAAFIQGSVSRYTTDATGRVTYTGRVPADVMISAVVAAEMASGTSKNVAFFIAKNGTVLSSSKSSNDVTSGAKDSTSLFWVGEIAQNDYFEIYVQNESNTTNIVAVDATLVAG